MTDVPAAVRKGVLALAAATVAVLAHAAYIQTWEAAEPIPAAMWMFTVGINGLFALLLVLTWRRHNWARWAALVLTGVGILAVVWSFIEPGGSSLLERTIDSIIVAVELWGCYHLLSKSASSWFRLQTAP